MRRKPRFVSGRTRIVPERDRNGGATGWMPAVFEEGGDELCRVELHQALDRFGDARVAQWRDRSLSLFHALIARCSYFGFSWAFFSSAAMSAHSWVNAFCSSAGSLARAVASRRPARAG